jgi:hypothetical protein
MCGHPKSERELLEEALNRRSVRDGDWCADGKLIIEAAKKHLATLPQPTRKVEVTEWLARRFGTRMGVYSTRKEAEWAAGPGGEVVKLTGEYWA